MRENLSTPTHRRKSLAERFRGKVAPNPKTGCLIWTGARGLAPHHNYGQINVDGRTVRAHRVAYECAHGPIPTGQLIRHTCHNPLCVNPEHLLAGTQKDNIDDMMRAGRGATTHGRKLNSRDAATIIGMRLLGMTRSAIAEAHGVRPTTVQNVLSGKTWPNAIDDELRRSIGNTRSSGRQHRRWLALLVSTGWPVLPSRRRC